MYTSYSDAQGKTNERTSLLFQIIHMQHKIPFFPMSSGMYEIVRPKLIEISRKIQPLNMFFDSSKECQVISGGNVTIYRNLAEAQNQTI